MSTEAKINEFSITLSQDPARAIQEMMDTIDALRQLYDQETAALKAGDSQAFFTLQDKKIAAARRYHDGATQIAGRREEFAGLQSPLKDKLTASEKEFKAATDSNIAALERMTRAVKRLNERIMRATRDAALKDRVNLYSNKGSIRQSDRLISTGLNESA